MLTYVLIWAALFVGMVLIVARQGSATTGLALAYFLLLSLIHTPGAVLAWYGTTGMPEFTQIGFEQTLYGMGSFLGGVALAYAFSPRPRLVLNMAAKPVETWQLNVLDRVAVDYMVIGAVAYFVLTRLLGNLATLNAVISSLGAVLVAGLCLRLWVQKHSQNSRRFWATVAFLPLIPLYTLIESGFLNAAISWLTIAIAFLFSQSKRKAFFCVLGPIGIFLGLSLFVNYMVVRGDLRHLVWYENAPLLDRFEKVGSMFSDFKLLDFNDLDQAQQIDLRLNQNWMVGLGTQRLTNGQVEFTNGASFAAMAIALIPRAIWPDKPAVGGGGDMVTKVTGVEFAEDTSVGIGQVLEFYMNFAEVGVLIGFMLWGLLLGFLDRRSAVCLYRGDHLGFVLWFVVGLSLIQPGGNLLEIEVSAVSSLIAVSGLSLIVIRRAQRRRSTASVHFPATARHLPHTNAFRRDQI